MTIRRLGHLVVLLALAATAMPSGCINPLRPDLVRPAKTSQGRRIVVLKSSANRYYDLPVELFIAQVDAEVQVFNVAQASDATVAATVDTLKPDMVFALGTRAASIAKRRAFSMPVLFAMVLNHQRLDLQGTDNFFGIALEMPTLIEFTKFKMVVPKLKRVLTFYSKEQSAGLIARAAKELKQLRIELEAIPVSNRADVERAYREKAKGADGIWLLNDSRVMVRPIFEFLKKRSLADRLPLMCSLSDDFTRAGALMSVSVDFHNLGSQAANLASGLLQRKRTPRQMGVQPPIGGKLVVNLGTAQQIGLSLDSDVLPLVNEVIER